MSLDFVVLGGDGTPEVSIPLPVDVHHELMVNSARHGLKELLKLSEYYEDQEFLFEDLPLLASQLKQLELQLLSDELGNLITELSNLVGYAILKKKKLHVLAD